MTCLVVKVPSSSFQKSKLVTPQPPSAARCETGKYFLFQRLLSALFCLLAFTACCSVCLPSLCSCHIECRFDLNDLPRVYSDSVGLRVVNHVKLTSSHAAKFQHEKNVEQTASAVERKIHIFIVSFLSTFLLRDQAVKRVLPVTVDKLLNKGFAHSWIHSWKKQNDRMFNLLSASLFLRHALSLHQNSRAAVEGMLFTTQIVENLRRGARKSPTGWQQRRPSRPPHPPRKQALLPLAEARISFFVAKAPRPMRKMWEVAPPLAPHQQPPLEWTSSGRG